MLKCCKSKHIYKGVHIFTFITLLSMQTFVYQEKNDLNAKSVCLLIVYPPNGNLMKIKFWEKKQFTWRGKSGIN